MWSLENGWRVELIVNSHHSDTFLMINEELGHIYKFRTGSTESTYQWLSVLNKILIQEVNSQKPINLMSFD